MSQPRLEPSLESPPGSPWYVVHLARYLFAQSYVADGLTLDIACGTGYGLPVLQSRARRVIGVELDPRAVLEAKQHADSSPPAAVIMADGCRLPFEDQTFDVVTSFETIEHLEERRQFVAELRRVLKTEGTCIFSTPNANHTKPINGKPRHPYHVHEYVPEELQAELSDYFGDVQMLGQALDERFRIPPFWDEQQEALEKDKRMRKNILLWRALNKVPVKSRDIVSRALWGHPLIPSENDYRFTQATVQTAPVLVAICRGAAS
jgi:SAM-dependent methyltransferase